jgi:hypothetical protein
MLATLTCIQEEYSENLDSSTVLAILSDYNLAATSELEAARQLLRALSSDDCD